MSHATPLTQSQQDLLEQLHDAHEGGSPRGGLTAAELADKRLDAVNLVIAGLAGWHPPRAPRILVPTPLARERVADIRKRRKAAKKGQRRAKRGQESRGA